VRKVRNPVVGVTKDEVLTAWIETGQDTSLSGSEVWAERLDQAGAMVDAPHRVGDASPTAWNLNAATDANGVFHVVYDAQLGTHARKLHVLKITYIQRRRAGTAQRG
jgi:hypothetical protein